MSGPLSPRPSRGKGPLLQAKPKTVSRKKNSDFCLIAITAGTVLFLLLQLLHVAPSLVSMGLLKCEVDHNRLLTSICNRYKALQSAHSAAAKSAISLVPASIAAATSSPKPSVWPDVYGGLAAPHKRIMKRCSGNPPLLVAGSLFAAHLTTELPGSGIIGVWLADTFGLWLCDSSGWSATLSLKTVGLSSFEGRAPSMELALSDVVIGKQGAFSVAWVSPGLMLGAGLLPQLASAQSYAPGVDVVRARDGLYVALVSNTQEAIMALSVSMDLQAAIADARAALQLDSIQQQLQAAQARAQARLRPVPQLVGVDGDPGWSRFTRKLADIMALNTASNWSTPDRLPHKYQWLWDSCYHTLGWNTLNHTRAWMQLQGMLSCQQADGFIPHICHGPSSSRMTQPPLLAWAVWDNYLYARDKERLRWAMPRLTAFFDWLSTHRSRDNGVTYFYSHGFESGMDNSPRFDSWAGAWRDDTSARCVFCSVHSLSVDLMALLAHEMAHMAKIFLELQMRKEAELYLSKGKQIAKALVQYAWVGEPANVTAVHRAWMRPSSSQPAISASTASTNHRQRHRGGRGFGGRLSSPGQGASHVTAAYSALGLQPVGPEHVGGVDASQLGFFYDWTQLPLQLMKRPSQVRSIAGLLPLLLPVGSLPSELAAALVSHILDDHAGFGSAMPLPSVALQERTFGDDMWRGPMWVNTNYLVARGLQQHGYHLLAARVKQMTVQAVRVGYETHGTVFEYYDALNSATPTLLSRKGSKNVGGVRDYHWTAALALRMVAELNGKVPQDDNLLTRA